MSQMHKLTEKIRRAAQKMTGTRLSKEDIQTMVLKGVLHSMQDLDANEIQGVIKCLRKKNENIKLVDSGSIRKKEVQNGTSTGMTSEKEKHAARRHLRRTMNVPRT
ncbi:hypothetical protein [Paremcibacter congregatus]|uniref:hypothetical protein n=1 Tax=Paremcibacter congregatus TaxID=2043170 RepID=UPI003A8D11C1